MPQQKSWFDKFDDAPAPRRPVYGPPAPADDWFAQFDAPARRTHRTEDYLDPPLEGSALGRFASNAGEMLNPVTIAKGLYGAVRHPIDTGGALIGSQVDQLRKARGAFGEGRYSEAVGHAGAGLLPVLGPIAAETGEQIGSGDVAGGLGKTAGILAPFGAAKALKGAKATIGLKPRVSSNAAEAAAVTFAEQKGIPLDAGTATGSQFVKNLQKKAGGSWGGASTVEAGQTKQATALARVGGDLASDANKGGPAVDAVAAGEKVRAALEAKIVDKNTVATTAYEKLRAFEQKAPIEIVQPVAGVHAPVPMQLAVDLTSSKTALAPIYERLLRESQLTPVQGAKGRALTALDRLMTGPDFADLSIVDEALSDLKALARGAEMPELRTQGQGIAAQAVKQLDAQVRARAAKAGPEVLKALEDGRAATKAKYELADVMELVTTAEPRATFNRLTAGKDAGITKLRALQRTAPDQVPDVARALLEDILDKPTSEGGFKFADKAQADWNRIGTETRNILFKPEQAKALDDFFLLAKKIGENPNPSGTAQVLNATNILAGVPMWALAKALYSPRTVKMLTTGARMSVSGTRAGQAAAAAQFTNAIRLATEGANPSLQPQGSRP